MAPCCELKKIFLIGACALFGSVYAGARLCSAARLAFQADSGRTEDVSADGREGRWLFAKIGRTPMVPMADKKCRRPPRSIPTGLLRLGRTVDDPLVAPSPQVHCRQRASRRRHLRAPILEFKTTRLSGRRLPDRGQQGRSLRHAAKNAHDFLKKIQWDGEKNIGESDFAYGGVGYGGKSRPDLSNTSMLMDALGRPRARGPMDPNVKEALILRLPLPEPGRASTTQPRWRRSTTTAAFITRSRIPKKRTPPAVCAAMAR